MVISTLVETFKISKKEIECFNNVPSVSFNKYVSPIINLANRFTKSTSPKKVGVQISEVFKLFLASSNENTFENWVDFCSEEIGEDKINKITEEIYAKVQEIAKVTSGIAKSDIKKWTNDLFFAKSYTGLNIQEVILKYIAEKTNSAYLKASPEDESKGIDGYIDGVAYSVKPKSYYVQNPSKTEWIDATMLFYDKTTRGLTVEVFK